jgi:hypothetical protein
MKWIGLLLALATAAGWPVRAWAHGTVGDYTFLEPLVADDANPKNEFDILKPGWVRGADGREFSLGFSLEKVIAKDSQGNNLFSIELANDWIYASPKEGPPASGFNDLELLPKLSLFTWAEHELRVSFGTKFVIPVGNSAVQDQNHTQIGPELLWAKGFGDLPDWSIVKYLRPLGIQGDFGYVPALGGATYHEMFADNVFEYSLPYLSNNVRDIGLKWPLRNVYLFTELNYDQLVTGPSGGTFPQLLATPGIAYMDYNVQISIGTQFALNNATVPNSHAAVLGLLDLFIDDIFPWTNWAPIQ